MSEKEQLRERAAEFRREAQEYKDMARRAFVDSMRDMYRVMAERLLGEAKECEHLARHS